MANFSQEDYANSSALLATIAVCSIMKTHAVGLKKEADVTKMGLFALHRFSLAVMIWRGYISLKLPTFSIERKFKMPKSVGKTFSNNMEREFTRN
jgi:hypothetical protein